MKIAVGSLSKRKSEMVKNVAEGIFSTQIEIICCDVESGVPETPWDKQTFDGACNRAKKAKEQYADADFAVGLESGLVERYGHIFEEAWVCVLQGNKEYFGYSSGLKVPDVILERMHKESLSHSDTMTIIEKEIGTSESDNTWGTYTGGEVSRSVSLEEALRNAFIQAKASPDSLFS